MVKAPSSKPRAEAGPAPAIDPVTKVPRAHSPEAQALPWPGDVPILVPGDLGDPRGPRDKKKPTIWCWLLAVFPDGGIDSPEELMAAVVHNELFRVQTEVMGRKQAVSLKYFALECSPKTVAALWNHVMSRLGYAVPSERLDYAETQRRGSRQQVDEPEA